MSAPRLGATGAIFARPSTELGPRPASKCVQNAPVLGAIYSREVSKANCVNRTYGAGDGNRTHVRSLGSFYTAIVRRPLEPNVTEQSSLVQVLGREAVKRLRVRSVLR
jgi:hypothetical protein